MVRVLANVNCFLLVVDLVKAFCWSFFYRMIGVIREFLGAERLLNGMKRSECSCLAEFFIF